MSENKPQTKEEFFASLNSEEQQVVSLAWELEDSIKTMSYGTNHLTSPEELREHFESQKSKFNLLLQKALKFKKLQNLGSEWLVYLDDTIISTLYRTQMEDLDGKKKNNNN